MQHCFSQACIDSYLETGNSAVTEGIYGHFSSQLIYKVSTFRASTGGLLNISHANQSLFSAYTIEASNEFKIKRLPITFGAIYLWKPFSTILNESNVALFAAFRNKQFRFLLGAHTRCYYFTQKARQELNFSTTTTTTLWEPLNLMYSVGYEFLCNQKWRAEVAVTNKDNYIIEQETNPRLRAGVSYKLSNKVQLYSDFGYIQAGLLNMRVNYFGVYVRGGLLWKIN